MLKYHTPTLKASSGRKIIMHFPTQDMYETCFILKVKVIEKETSTANTLSLGPQKESKVFSIFKLMKLLTSYKQ